MTCNKCAVSLLESGDQRYVKALISLVVSVDVKQHKRRTYVCREGQLGLKDCRGLLRELYLHVPLVHLHSRLAAASFVFRHLHLDLGA